MIYPERLKELGLPSLEYRREGTDLIQVYKIINGPDKVRVNKYFAMTSHAATRRQTKKNKKICRKKNIRVYSFSNRVVDSWNSLSEYVVIAP